MFLEAMPVEGMLRSKPDLVSSVHPATISSSIWGAGYPPCIAESMMSYDFTDLLRATHLSVVWIPMVFHRSGLWRWEDSFPS